MTPDRTATWTRPDGTHWKTVNTADRSADVLQVDRRQLGELELEFVFGTGAR